MKNCSKCKESLPLDMFCRDSSKESGYRSQCKNCTRKLSKNYYLNNKEKVQVRKLRTKNQIKESSRIYYRKNKAKIAHNTRKRQALKLSATPTWLTEQHLNEILMFYELAKEISILTEEPYEVDHIIPLQGENACGLHVPWNLQILSRSENRKKSNRLLQ